MTRPSEVLLRYGHSSLTFAFPPGACRFDIKEPQLSVSRAAFDQGLARLLPDPLPPGPIAIVVADKTRLCGYPQSLPWLTDMLRARGAGPERVTFYIAYGNHAPQSEAESLSAYGPVFREYPFRHHRSTDTELFAELGQTSRGTPISVRKELLAARLILTVGALSHHYFAGFGGGRKLLFPGLGEQAAIYRNHALYLDPATGELASGCRPGQLNGNPLAEDLAEIQHLLPPYLSIHCLLDSQGRVAAHRFGRSYEDFLACCQELDALYRCDPGRSFPLVLASAGGHPKDINFIQAHKALDNAAAFVSDGGTLLLLAACPDGIGSTTFLPYFDLGSREAAFAQLAAHYSGNGGTALSMMAKSLRIRIGLVTDLPPDLCRRIGVERFSPEEAAQLVAESLSGCAVLPNSSLLLRV